MSTKAELQAELESLQETYQRDISERDERISELTASEARLTETTRNLSQRLNQIQSSNVEATQLSLELTQALGLALFSRTHPELAERMNKVANG